MCLFNGKYFRCSLYKNDCPSLQGMIGVYYDSYRNVNNGPETFEICFYFFAIEFEFGKKLKL